MRDYSLAKIIYNEYVEQFYPEVLTMLNFEALSQDVQDKWWKVAAELKRELDSKFMHF